MAGGRAGGNLCTWTTEQEKFKWLLAASSAGYELVWCWVCARDENENRACNLHIPSFWHICNIIILYWILNYSVLWFYDELCVCVCAVLVFSATYDEQLSVVSLFTFHKLFWWEKQEVKGIILQLNCLLYNNDLPLVLMVSPSYVNHSSPSSASQLENVLAFIAIR